MAIEAALDKKLALLDEKIAELDSKIREANGTLKDIRAERAAAEKTIRDFREGLEEKLAEIVEASVAAGLKEWSESIDKAIDDATQTVYHRFDVIADALTGMDRASRAEGKPPLEALARRVKAQRALDL